MEITAIVYHSSAGTSKQYALRLGELTGLPAVPLKQAKRTLAGKPVLFVSWICSGLLMNYERACKKLDVRAVCAVGISEESQARKDLAELQNLSGANIFHLPGVFDMGRLNLIQRRLMKDMLITVRARIRDPKRVTQADIDTYNMLRNGTDHYDERALQPVLNWLTGNMQ